MRADLVEPAKAIYNQAFALHQQGRLADAQITYERALRLQRHPATLAMLGVIALELGNTKAAIALLDEAVASDPADAMAHIYHGIGYSRLGRHEAAIGCYDKAIAVDPESNALPHYNRANALFQLKRYEAAVDGYDRAISIESDLDAEAYFERGIALQLLKRPEAAIASFERAIALGSPRKSAAHFHRGASLQVLEQHDSAVKSFDNALALTSDYVDAHRARATSLHRLGLYEEALVSCDALIALKPGDSEAHYNRGVVQAHLARLDAAIESFSRALSVRPDYVPALIKRGLALAHLLRHQAALSDYETAISLDPDCAEAHYNRGNALAELGRLDEALAAYEAAIHAKRDFGAAYAAAGALLQKLGRIEEAERMLRLGIELDPSHVYLRIDLGNVLKDGGSIDSAIECYRKALELDPHCLVAHSNLAFSLMYTSEVAQPILSECRRFNERFAAPLRSDGGVRGTGHSSGTRLRIGYVSPDFRSHCQSLFTLPLLENHDHTAFEIVCYSSVAQPDDVTQVIRSHADIFRDVRGLDDTALAALVRDDRIDILVDLTMHMAGGRPLLFARRPAPVQVAWLAYPGTTGIEAIDYRFSDPRLDPPDFEAHYSERTIRLPDAFWCYAPRGPRAPTPGINPLPAVTRGYLTLGCLNNPCKLTDRTLRLWAPLLRQLPTARLLLMMPPGKYRSQLLARARAAGFDESMVQFVANRPRNEYLSSYHDIDLCLDTLPYNGHTTSLDALWMGVPTVTRVGMTSPGRAGLSLLYQVGLTELAADTDDGFVSAALALANNLQRLASLRKELRSRLESSPLMNGQRFAANVEAAYREILRSKVSG
ncbi:MAG: tetratricopeptide repeat protein [Steroidobacteraceae bacterium]